MDAMLNILRWKYFVCIIYMIQYLSLGVRSHYYYPGSHCQRLRSTICPNGILPTTQWTSCSTTCGPGVQERQLTCVQMMSHNDPYCSIPNYKVKETRHCNVRECPSWGQWYLTGTCDETVCPSPQGTYKRDCRDPLGTATACIGSDTQTVPCTLASGTLALLPGVRFERWNIGLFTDIVWSNGVDDYDYTATPDETDILPHFDSSSKDQGTDTFGQTTFGVGAEPFYARLSTYFKPPLDGSYKFYLTADDQATLRVAEIDSSCNPGALITDQELTEYQQKDLFDKSGQISTSITLSKDKLYFIQSKTLAYALSDFVLAGVEFEDGLLMMPFHEDYLSYDSRWASGTNFPILT